MTTKTKVIVAGKLESEGLKKIGKGAIIAVIGALVPFLITISTSYDFGEWGPIVGAVCAILANYLRKRFLSYSIQTN